MRFGLLATAVAVSLSALIAWGQVRAEAAGSRPAARADAVAVKSRPPYADSTVSPRARESSRPSTGPVPYPIVYVRAPRYGDDKNSRWPEVMDPLEIDAGTDLVLLHPDGAEEVLVPGGAGAVLDPYVSFDAQWVYYAKIHDATKRNIQRRNAPLSGSDIFKIHLQTRQVVPLTFQEWTPNTGAARWSAHPLRPTGRDTNYLCYGIVNLGPCPLPGGKVMFTSSRNSFLPNKDYTFPNLQLFVMDDDGRNVEQIGHMNLGSALHPTVLVDGRVMFSSYEAQGVRDKRLWGLWAIWPDGRHWEPLLSAFKSASVFHFMTQRSDGAIVVEHYYNQNDNGFGSFVQFSPAPPAGAPPFGFPSPWHPSNPKLRQGNYHNGKPYHETFPFSPPGLAPVTAFTHGRDEAAPRDPDGDWAGKVTHPSGAPDNDLLLVWTPGPANDLQRPTNRPYYDGGIYLLRGGRIAESRHDLLLVKNDPRYNEMQPRAVVPFADIYGVAQPRELPWLPNDGTLSPELPTGTPFGLIGTSSFYKRNTAPGLGKPRFDGLDPFNTSENDASSNWFTQGADAGRYDNDDIYAVRILALEPTTHRSYGPHSDAGFLNHADERMRILGEIPLRKYDSGGSLVLDGDGNPDTSFLAKIPADVPFTFQTIDRNGLVLNMSQTWHQLRPGEIRNDCRGCHAHSQVGTDFALTAAAKLDYRIVDLTRTTPLLAADADGNTVVETLPIGGVDIEYYHVIKPLLQRSCVPCHSKNGKTEADLVLDDDPLVGGYENTYHRLANDTGAQYGRRPMIRNGTWRETNASRYVRKFQSRRSLLIWKVFGRRLDGWRNEDHPTETVPGDKSTFPEGANPNDGDIDFLGTIMPPPDSPVPPLSEHEKMLFARWVDLGCPIDRYGAVGRPGKNAFGWYLDELRPTLTLSSPRPGDNPGALTLIRIGAFDYYSGLDRGSLSAKASFPIAGKPPGTELAPLFSETADHVWTLALRPPIKALAQAEITVRIRDKQGNVASVVRSFRVR